MEENINNDNDNTDNYSIIPECPICLESLEISNTILTTDCCSQDTHLTCLTNWIKNSNNKNNLLCPICRQTSELLIDISSPQEYNNYNNPPNINPSDNSQNVINIFEINNNNSHILPTQSSTDSSSIIDILVTPTTMIIRYKYLRAFCKLCMLGFFGFIFYSIIKSCTSDMKCA